MGRTLVYNCPDCKRKLRAIKSMNSATQVVVRGCGGCGARWQLKVVPMAVAGVGWMDTATIVKKEGK